MKLFSIFIFFLILAQLPGCAQKNNDAAGTLASKGEKVGGSCEGCEVIYDSSVPFEKLNWIDTLPDYNEPGPKLIVSGIIYQSDRRTPAKDVVLYVYHTDQQGKYSNRNNEKAYAGKHGYIKGWIKTNDKGEYKFYTLKPAPYPGSNIPAHIHPVIKETGINEYYVDEYLFDDDPFLTQKERERQEKRGGNGVVETVIKDSIRYCKRDIYLGLNIPNHPGNGADAVNK